VRRYRIEIKPTAEQDLDVRYLQIAEESPQNALHLPPLVDGALLLEQIGRLVICKLGQLSVQLPHLPLCQD